MSGGYNLEEQELINSIRNRDDKVKLHKASELLVKKSGDMSFNAKLKKDPTLQNDEIKSFLCDYTFKTRNLNQATTGLNKLNIISELQETNLPIAEYEKISVADYGALLQIHSLFSDEKNNKIFDYIFKAGNEEYKELHKFMKAVSNRVEKDEKALESGNAGLYKSGDLMMHLTSKTVALKDQQKWLGHEGKLEEIFVTKHNHAAPLYIRHDEEQPIVSTSDIWMEQTSGLLNFGKILQSDGFRIDPTKLVDQKIVKKLETIDYGYKEDAAGNAIRDKEGNKVKITWQDLMRQRYEQLSEKLHKSQLPYRIKQLEKERAEIENQDTGAEAFAQFLWDALNLNIDDLNIYLEQAKEDKEKLSITKTTPENEQELIKLTKIEEILTTIKSHESKKLQKLDDIDKLMKESKHLLMQNDRNRLYANHWINSKILLQGHTNLMSKNDLRQLSEQMFNASPLGQEKALSNFQKDLSSKDKIDELYNHELDAFNGTTKFVNIGTALPKKLYTLLENAENSAAFQAESSKIIKEYFKSAYINEGVINNAIDNLFIPDAKNIYAKYSESPKKDIKQIYKMLNLTCLDIIAKCQESYPENAIPQSPILHKMNKEIKKAGLGVEDLICSEFAGKSIASVIEQLNRITVSDLIFEDLIDQKDTTILQSPFKDENFINLHPERLVSILEKAGCVERIINPHLKEFIQLENTVKSKNVEFDCKTLLPKKLYSLLQETKNEAEFKETGKIAMEIYLKAAQVSTTIIDKIRKSDIDNTLSEIYKNHKKHPEGVIENICNFCIKILEFCHILTKDKAIKDNLKTMIQHIDTTVKSLENRKQNIPKKASLLSQEHKKTAVKIVQQIGQDNIGKVPANKNTHQSSVRPSNPTLRLAR